jgi:hypothetical protein
VWKLLVWSSCVRQLEGWRPSGGDGHTGLMVTEEICASLVRRHGVVPCGRETCVRTLFEGSAVLS